jgi:catechol 2,3-dioxygenase-like lactoylglutathione lyase family enzyme
MAHPIRALVPFVHVRNVPESIAFYEKLGMTVGNTFVPPDASEPAWAWLQSGIAQLMLAKATEPVIPAQQAVLFYLYVEDVTAKHEELRQGGVPVGDIQYPFFAPRGEFRITDPDGYVLMITHT